MKKRRTIMVLSIIASLLTAMLTCCFAFMQMPRFGRLPQGERLERIKHSPHYRDGEFHNLDSTVLMTGDQGRWKAMWNFLFDKPEGLRPALPVPTIKTNLKMLHIETDLVVWFGHSSYLLQLAGRRILVDPVFCAAAPVSFVNRPFHDTDIYEPDDMPEIDYLVISHDHWDHLDYKTVKQLRPRVGKVVVPLGVGEHFERWGFDPQKIIELDWMESASPEEGFMFHCLPARHFSGRGLKSNQTLWASFMVETPTLNVFIGGDGGYGSHFKMIGERFSGRIDLAIIENGQYNEQWRHIHTMPDELHQVVADLNPHEVMTVHHSKYALAKHPWDEPMRNEAELSEKYSIKMDLPLIGEAVPLPSQQ